MSAFDDGIISGKSLTEMRVEPNFVAAGVASTKANWVEDCSGAFCYEREAFACPVIVSSFGGCGVISWLEKDKTKTQAGEVSAQHYQLAMVKVLDAWIG